MDEISDLEKLKIEAIKLETKKIGRQLTGPEALKIERDVESKYYVSHPKTKDAKRTHLPLDMYRFD